MKFFFLLGGFAGFVVTFTTAVFLAAADADLALRDAALGALAGAFLFRWFRTRLVSSFTLLLAERTAAAATALAAAEAESAATAAATATVTVGMPTPVAS